MSTRRLYPTVESFIEETDFVGRGNAGDIFTQELLDNMSLIGERVFFNKPLEKRVQKLHPYSEENSAWIKNQEWIIRAIRFSDKWGDKIEYLLEHNGAAYVTEHEPKGSLVLENKWYSAIDGRWLTDEQVKELDIKGYTDRNGRYHDIGKITIDNKEHSCYENKKLAHYIMAYGKELLFDSYEAMPWRNPIGRFNARTEEEIETLTKPLPLRGHDLLPYALKAASKLGWNRHKTEEVIQMAEVFINEYKSADCEVVSIESGKAKLNLTVEEAKELLTKIPDALKEYENTRYNALADQVKLLTAEMLKIRPKAKK